MINLRYHIVSLVAVFLSLALGIVIGTTALDQGTITLLESERNALARHRDRLLDEKADVQTALDLWERFGRSIVPSLIQDRLRGRPIVLLTQDEESEGVREAVERALAGSGACLCGHLSLTDKWALTDEPSREQLALVIGSDEREPDPLLGAAAEQLAARLATAGDLEQQGDLITGLARNGFLDLGKMPDGNAFPRPGSLVVLVTSDDTTAAPPRDRFVFPFLAELVGGAPALVADGLGADDPVSDRIRRDDVLGGTIATVDHADTLLGELSIVFALRDALQGLPPRHFGVREGATAIAPEI